MKKHLSKSVLILLALGIAACQQDPQSANGPKTVLPLKSSPPPANPAITYVADIISKGYMYATIGVMDTTAANATNIVTASFNTNTGTFSSPSWNYNAASIAYGSYETSSQAINAVDVSVNSKGVPVGSNQRTIYSLSASDSIRIQSGPAWCATSATGKMAFTRIYTDKAHFGKTDLCIISQSGGTPTVLDVDTGTEMQNGHPILKVHYLSATWCPDDSKIAVVRSDTNGVPNGTTIASTILIVNASTGERLDSIQSTMVINRIEWSRTGANELAFTASSGGAYQLYYVVPTTGATISTNNVGIGNGPTWSPNNSSILGSETGVGLIKLIPFTTTQSTVSSNGGGAWLNWKR
ncbi:MAG TPA: hypothetical protein VGM92_14950 [Candidatus Kapabacteria bacterium]|jgi:hypothetical protein